MSSRRNPGPPSNCHWKRSTYQISIETISRSCYETVISQRSSANSTTRSSSGRSASSSDKKPRCGTELLPVPTYWPWRPSRTPAPKTASSRSTAPPRPSPRASTATKIRSARNGCQLRSPATEKSSISRGSSRRTGHSNFATASWRPKTQDSVKRWRLSGPRKSSSVRWIDP